MADAPPPRPPDLPPPRANAGNGWAPGIIVLLVAVIGLLGAGLFIHVDKSSEEHHAMAAAFDRLGCVLSLQDYRDRARATVSGDPCRYLREMAGRGDSGP